MYPSYLYLFFLRQGRCGSLYRSFEPTKTCFYCLFLFCVITPRTVQGYRRVKCLQTWLILPHYVCAYPRSGASSTVVVFGSCLSKLFFKKNLFQVFSFLVNYWTVVFTCLVQQRPYYIYFLSSPFFCFKVSVVPLCQLIFYDILT